MLLWIALCLAFINALITPYCNGLYYTSLWYAKISTPEEMAGTPEEKQFNKTIQAALTDGWPSTVIALHSTLIYVIVIVGIVYVWWWGIIIFVIAVFLSGTIDHFFKKNLTYILNLYSYRLANREADYRKNNDLQRADAAHEFNAELMRISFLYFDTKIKVPTTAQIKENPAGDPLYLLALYS